MRFQPVGYRFSASRLDAGRPVFPCEAFAESYRALTPVWIIPVLMVGIAVASVLGGILGRKIMKKHFERSEII